MCIVIALSDVRASRMRKTLHAFARESRAAIVETRTSVIVAEKIHCQDSLVELINAAGDYFVVSYLDIVAITAAALGQITAFDRSGDWRVAVERKSRGGTGKLLVFSRRRRRRSALERASRSL